MPVPGSGRYQVIEPSVFCASRLLSWSPPKVKEVSSLRSVQPVPAPESIPALKVAAASLPA